MSGFLLRMMINAVVLYWVIAKVPGLFVDTLGGMLLGIVLMGIANGALRPLMSMASLPLNWRTLGSATICTNVLVSLLVIHTLPGFKVYSLVAPVAGIFLMTVCSFTLSKVIQDR